MVFSDYMRPAARLAALMKIPSIFVWTHDSVGVGEDGPTHEPVEHLAALRAIPDLLIIRPGDPNETAAAWRYALTHRRRPVGLMLSRQALPTLPGTRSTADSGLERGAYVLADSQKSQPDVILIASGSEVALAMAARDQLDARGVAARVVSMASWELFNEQDAEYQAAVLPPQVSARVSIEAGITQGWTRYVGPAGTAIGIDRFGESGKGPAVMAHLGMTVEKLVEVALKLAHEHC